MGKSWFRKRGGRLSRLSPQRGTGPCVARLTSPGSGTERPAASGPGALGAPAVPGAGHARGVALGPTRRAWDTVGRKREVPHQGPLAPGRAVWTSQRSGSGVRGRKSGGCARGTGYGGATETPVCVGGERGRPGRRGLGASGRRQGRRPPRLRASPAPRPGSVPGSRPCAGPGPQQRFLSDSVQFIGRFRVSARCSPGKEPTAA